jgi:hypothetical protein
VRQFTRPPKPKRNFSPTGQSVTTLPLAFRFPGILVAAIPALAVTDDRLVQDASTLAAALLLLSAIGASQDDLKITVRLLRQARLAVLFPVTWMVLQIAPLNQFANSIWPTASAALNEPLVGHISIEPGATIRSLFEYLATISLMVATTVFTRGREQAEITLFVLCAVTTFMSVEVLLGHLGPLAAIVPTEGQSAAATFVAISAFGAVVNAAAAVRILERCLSRGDDALTIVSILVFCLGLAGSATCFSAIVIAGKTEILIAAGFGMGVILLVGTSRIVELRPVATFVLFAVLALAAVTGTVAVSFEDKPAMMPILRSASSADADSLSATQRALSDTKWAGSGVGTFDMLVPVFRDFSSKPAVDPASTIAKAAIEWGWAALIVLVLLTVQLSVVMFAGALRRGRDWFFPAAASACVLVAFCEALCDTSLIHPSSQIMLAIILGLGLSQTKGRTSGL